MAQRGKVSFWCNENIKVSVVIGAQLDDYTKKHSIVYFAEFYGM